MASSYPQRIALQHILVRNHQLAEQLHGELMAGAEFSAIAREYSVCPSATNQGICGSLPLDDLPTAVLAALAPLENDQDPANSLYPAPIKSHHGFHLLKVTERLQRALLTEAEEV